MLTAPRAPRCLVYLGLRCRPKKDSSATKTGTASSLEDDLGEEDVKELVLVESPRPDGSIGRIIYRCNSPVNAAELEALCIKVGWPPRPLAKVSAALANSFLVAALYLQVSGLLGDLFADLLGDLPPALGAQCYARRYRLPFRRRARTCCMRSCGTNINNHILTASSRMRMLT